MKIELDVLDFYMSLDEVRIQRKMTWRQVATQTGLSVQSIYRLRKERYPCANYLTALLVWSKLDINRFVWVTADGEPACRGQAALDKLSSKGWNYGTDTRA